MRPRHHRGRAANLLEEQGGATYVEFLIAFIPMFILFLGMLQAALLYAGNLVVTHAANAAARSAVVVLPDDPERYDGESINDLRGPGRNCDDLTPSFLSSPVAASGSCRLQAIRWAAGARLLAVSPSLDQIIHDENVMQAIGGNPWGRAGAGLLYNKGHLAVTFPARPGSTEYRETFGPNDDITVRVTYAFHCGVPLVNRFMCDDALSFITGAPTALVQDTARATSTGDPVLIQNAVQRMRTGMDRLRRARPATNEILRYAEEPAIAGLAAVYGSRYVLIRAEATMRNHGAPYSY